MNGHFNRCQSTKRNIMCSYIVYSQYIELYFMLWYNLSAIHWKGGFQVANKLYKPGEDNKPRGEYREVGPRGGQVPRPRQVTIDPGDRLPPTQEPGRRWEKI